MIGLRTEAGDPCADGEPSNGTETASLTRVEPTCRDVDVLGFNIQFAAMPAPGPTQGGIKQLVSNACTSVVRVNAKIPHHDKIVSSFEAIDAVGVICERASPNPSGVRIRPQKPPI